MDNKQKTGSPDRERVNVNEDYELQYWSNKFRVTTDRLKNAVNTVGTTPKDVGDYLEKQPLTR